MANDKYIIGLFDHEDKLVKAVRAFKEKGIDITNTLTPFPVHGLENELGYEESRLHTAGFIFGLTGFSLALFVMTWVSVSNYPLNVGGKPFWALPAFIPIIFELTVLFSAVGMVMVYLKRNNLFPGFLPRIYDDRITDDRFALVFEVNDDTTKNDVENITNLLNGSNVTEIKMKEFEENGEMFSSIEREFIFEGAGTVAPKKVVQSAPMASVKATPSSKEKRLETDLKNQLLNEIGSVSESDKDDLKKIKGIGKVFEGKLNSLGVYTFAQVAKLNAASIEAVESLTGFPGRVEREDWIGQANLLKDGGTTDFSNKVDDGGVY